jgi:hypothetical protein
LGSTYKTLGSSSRHYKKGRGAEVFDILGSSPESNGIMRAFHYLQEEVNFMGKAQVSLICGGK